MCKGERRLPRISADPPWPSVSKNPSSCSSTTLHVTSTAEVVTTNSCYCRGDEPRSKLRVEWTLLPKQPRINAISFHFTTNGARVLSAVVQNNENQYLQLEDRILSQVDTALVDLKVIISSRDHPVFTEPLTLVSRRASSLLPAGGSEELPPRPMGGGRCCPSV